MKRISKCFFVVMLTFIMILSSSLTAFGAEGNSVKVQYNGENIQSIKDVKIVNGCTMLPLQQICDVMGVDITYDAATKKVAATTPEKKLSFTVGKTTLAINEGGVILSETMEVAPFIDRETGILYAPVRSIAESFGRSVGWDGTNQTVIIIDPNTIFGNADEDFAIISKLIKTELDTEKAYRTVGSFHINLDSYDTSEFMMSPFALSVDGTVSGIQQKSNADLLMKLSVNADKMMSSLSEEEKLQAAPFVNMFKDISMKMKMNGDTGVTYLNSNLFTAIDPTMDQNTWLKMNLYDENDSLGGDWSSMNGMSYSEIDLSEALADSVSNMYYADTSTYQEMKTAYEFFKNLMGNSAFKQSNEGTYTTYTLNLDKTTILAAIAKTALTKGVLTDNLDMSEIGDILSSADLSSEIVIKEKSGSLYQYTLKGNYAYEDIDCTFNMSGDSQKMVSNVTIDMINVMKIEIKADSQLTETSKKPDVTPSKDAKVIEFPTY